MTEIDAQVPLVPTPQATQQDDELHLEEPAEQQTEETAPEETQAETPPKNWDKLLQKRDHDAANFRKATEKKLSEIAAMIQGANKPATVQQASDRLTKIKAALSGERRKDFDLIMPGLSDLLDDLSGEIEARGNAGNSDEVKGLKDQLEYELFFAKYPQTYREEFEKQQREFEEEDGLTGPALKGAMTVWFKRYVADNAAKKETGNTPRAASGSGTGRVIPASPGPRRTVAPDIKKNLQSGRTGNIGGIPFRP